MPDKSENHKKSSPKSQFVSQKKDVTVSKRNQHVVPRNKGWAVRTEGNTRDTFRAGTQQEALGRAREIAQNQGSEVIVHGRDGKIAGREVLRSDDWELVPLESTVVKSPELGLDKYIDNYFYGNRPHIRGRRVLVSMIAANHEVNNWGISQLAEEFTLSEEQVLAALLYYREHKAEIDQQDIEAQRQFDEDYKLHGEINNS